jgi:hypothetical protein
MFRVEASRRAAILKNSGEAYTVQVPAVLPSLNEALNWLLEPKVVGSYYGRFCGFSRCAQVIAGILGAAERRLARLGWTPTQMRAAARREAELHPPPGARSLPESKPKSWSGHRAHR